MAKRRLISATVAEPGAGDYFKSDKPVSREVKVPEGAELLARLAELVEE